MTLQEYQLLSPLDQEVFINNGGVLSSIQEQPSQVVTTQPVQTSSTTRGNVEQTDSIITDSQSDSTSFKDYADEHFEGFAFKDPVELLFYCDAGIASGRVTLYDWQIQFMMDFAAHSYDDKHPFQSVVQACNGSGKDRYILATCIVWLAMRWRKTICVVTSSSAAQLDNQTCRYIKALAQGFNAKFSKDTGSVVEVWKCNYRNYQLDFSKLGQLDGSVSHVFCYATDEEKKAEGYHPSEFGAKMGIFVSEDKSVLDEINVAINKCTGYTHRVHVSTPGLPLGHFYDYCNLAIPRENINDCLKDVQSEDWIKYFIPASKCKGHLHESYIKMMERDLPGGKNGAAYKSQVDAEFGSGEAMVVIPYTYIWRAFTHLPTHVPEEFNTAGLDLSDGGDETCLAIRNGNRLLKVIPFKFEDTEDTHNHLIDLFNEYDLKVKGAKIYADAGGIGAPILKRLKRMGWTNIVFVVNNNTSYQPLVYANRGTEVFFNMRKLLERREIGLLNEPKLNKQLAGRYYRLSNKNVHQLLSKAEQKSKGYPSPDRADAVNLCFWGFKSTFIEVPEDKEERPFHEQEKEESEKIDTSLNTFDLRAHFNSGSKRFPHPMKGLGFSSLKEELAEYNKNIKLIKS